jgi:hypothetical protein
MTTMGLLRRFSPRNDNRSEDINEKFSKKVFTKGVFLTAMLICLFPAISCGRKALPLPPKTSEPPVVENLKADQIDGKLQLTWPIPKTAESDELAGFYVYRSKEKSSDLPCSQCPVRFDKVGDIAYDTVSILFEKKVVYTEIIEKGYQYKYRVTGYSAYGDEGLPSEEITIDY